MKYSRLSVSRYLSTKLNIFFLYSEKFSHCFLPRIELRTLRVWGARDDHYTTETRLNCCTTFPRNGSEKWEEKIDTEKEKLGNTLFLTLKELDTIFILCTGATLWNIVALLFPRICEKSQNIFFLCSEKIFDCFCPAFNWGPFSF